MSGQGQESIRPSLRGPRSLETIRKSLSGPLTFSSYKSTTGKTLGRSFPDILRVKCSDGCFLHFAAAMIVHLPETSSFRRIQLTSDDVRMTSKTCPHPLLPSLCGLGASSFLERLFVLSFLPRSLLSLRPLSDDCLVELCKNYIWSSVCHRGVESRPASSSSRRSVADEDDHSSLRETLEVVNFACLVPDSSRRSSQLKSYQHRYLMMAHESAIYIVQAMDSRRAMVAREEDRYFLKIVASLRSASKARESSEGGGMCRWRGCRIDAASSRKGLCQYHEELKVFMEGAPGASSGYESSHYLPRKIPAPHGMNELAMMKASSNLITELWDGKLKEIVKNFVKRMVADMNLRQRYRQTLRNFELFVSFESGSIVTSPAITSSSPSWLRWRDVRVLERVKDFQEKISTDLRIILINEKKYTEYLQELSRMEVYPSHEVAIVKRDLASLRESKDSALYSNGAESSRVNDLSIYEADVLSLAMEKSLSIRKLALISRRLEEQVEVQSQHRKKLARMKAAEEAQAKDPRNFRNQSKY